MYTSNLIYILFNIYFFSHLIWDSYSHLIYQKYNNIFAKYLNSLLLHAKDPLTPSNFDYLFYLFQWLILVFSTNSHDDFFFFGRGSFLTIAYFYILCFSIHTSIVFDRWNLIWKHLGYDIYMFFALWIPRGRHTCFHHMLLLLLFFFSY